MATDQREASAAPPPTTAGSLAVRAIQPPLELEPLCGRVSLKTKGIVLFRIWAGHVPKPPLTLIPSCRTFATMSF